ncbi:hypothetical protein [Streptomyces sp. ODS28]|uniref:hypothetical protein n=1 Tax=Streptomyces sp. ODS28 TaxID=3136688 RepID=UPI0031E4F0CE
MLDSRPTLESLLHAWHDAREREQEAMRRAQESAGSEGADDALTAAEREAEEAKAERMRLEELYWEEFRLQQMPGYT